MPETPRTAELVTTMPLEMGSGQIQSRATIRLTIVEPPRYKAYDTGVTWESAYWALGLATGPVSALMGPMRAGHVNLRVKVRNTKREGGQ